MAVKPENAKCRWQRRNSNPTHGSPHHRSPAEIGRRTIHDRAPRRTARRAATLNRREAFDGILYFERVYFAF